MELNITKTKDMFVNFTKHGLGRTAAIMHGEPVGAVHQYKYLDTVINDKANTKVIIKKCQQRQYFLRKLNYVGVSRNILTIFYNSFIEINVPFICWFHSLTIQRRSASRVQ